MASAFTAPNGHTHVSVKAANGKRRPVRLGVLDSDDADEAERRLTKLEKLHAKRQPVDPMTRAWLQQLEPEHYDRVARTGLLGAAEARDAEMRSNQQRGGPVKPGEAKPSARSAYAPVRDQQDVYHKHGTLSALIVLWRATLDVDPKTLKNYDQHVGFLKRYFGDDKPVGDLIPADADAAFAWARERGKKNGKPAARSTVSRAVKTWKTLFDYAARLRWVTRAADAAPDDPTNPFDHLRAEGEWNPDRDFYITRRLCDKLIEEAPDLELKALIALSRYATFRGPSEFSRLKWQDIDFERQVIHITASKTKRHRGGLRRVAPLEGEALKIVQQLYDEAHEGATMVLPSLGDADSSNHSQRLERLCRRLGVALWPKPWMNMRASCETDWQIEGVQIFETAKWMGHSPTVALQHYNRVAKDQVVDLPSALLRGGGALSAEQAERSTKRSAVADRESAENGRKSTVADREVTVRDRS